jgi:hypothetical protein
MLYDDPQTIGRIHAHVTLDPAPPGAQAPSKPGAVNEQALANYLRTAGQSWMTKALDRELLEVNVHVRGMEVEQKQSLEIFLLLGAVVSGIRSYNDLFSTIETAVNNTRSIIERIVDLWLGSQDRADLMAIVDSEWQPDPEFQVIAGAAQVRGERVATEVESHEGPDGQGPPAAPTEGSAAREAMRRAAIERRGIPPVAWQVVLLALGALSYIVVLIVAAAVVLRLVD